jgi:hypothetical protein
MTRRANDLHRPSQHESGGLTSFDPTSILKRFPTRLPPE